MTRRLMVLLATLGLAGGTMFQANGCTADIMVSSLDSLFDSSSCGYYEPVTTTVDPLGVDIDLPYFDEGDYFEVPGYLF